MTVTICICTRNRAPMLVRALKSLTRLVEVEGVDWEVLVIDNGSSDGSAAAAAPFEERLAMRVVREERAGIAYARNRALDIAEGDWTLWFDDDATVRPDWLEAFAGGVRRHGGADFFGGPIIARFKGVDPRWVKAVKATVGGAYGWYLPRVGESEIRTVRDPIPWGSNMAFRRSAVGEMRFDTGLGRRPGRLVISGEDTMFSVALMEHGRYGCWLPGMRVIHHVPRERVRAPWIDAYFHGLGWEQAVRWAGGEEELREATRQRCTALRHDRAWHRRIRRRFAPLEVRLADLRRGAEMRGFVEGVNDRSPEGCEENAGGG